MNPNRLVLVVGANFVNQGAYLMLTTVASQTEERFHGVPVIDQRLGSFSQRRELGALTLVPQKLERFIPIWLAKLSRKVKSGYGFAKASEVKAVLDISGFRYGDQWVELGLEKYANRLKRFSDAGVPVFMLPQAFGPFTEDSVARAGRTAITASTLVFARDPESFQYAKDLFVDDPKRASRILLAPDFTGPVDGLGSPEAKRMQGRVPIVPNWNIYKRASSSDAEAYVAGLAAMVRHLQELGYHPYGLCHEASGDREILEHVAARADGLEILGGLDGLQLKGVIGAAPLVVAGRFHAISSALSQAVPTVIHGWSHKYRWMARDYGVEKHMVSPYADPDAQVLALQTALSDVHTQETLRSEGAHVHELVDKMWRQLEVEFAAQPTE